MIPCCRTDGRQRNNTLFGLLASQIKGVCHSCQIVVSGILCSRSGLWTLHFRAPLLCQFLVELLFGQTGLILAVLLVVHGELEQLFVVLSAIPTQFFHLFDILRQHVRIKGLRVVGIELHTLLFRQFDDLRSQCSGQFAGLAEDHAPHSRIHTRERFLAHRTAEDIHQRGILHVLREWRYQAWCTEHRPYALHFLEQFHKQLIFA